MNTISGSTIPNKWLNEKGIEIKKQQYKVSNWTEYNKSLKSRGDIEVWLSQDLLENWCCAERIYDGTGSSKYYSDEAIIACHEIRQVYKLPLRALVQLVTKKQKYSTEAILSSNSK